MLPSLKSSYDSRFQKVLAEVNRNPEVLREVIDERMVDEMERSLDKLTSILKAPELSSLGTLHLGLQKAHTELSNVMTYGSIRSWAHDLLPKGFTALGRLAAFTTGVTKLLKKLPKFVKIVKGSMGAERRAEWDPNKPIEQLLDSATASKLLSVIIKEMEPSSGLLSFARGLPYINDKEAAAELLGLSFNQLSSFSKASQAVDIPIEKLQAKELGQDIKSVVDQPEEQPKFQAQAQPERKGQKLIIPGAEKQQAAVPAGQSSPAITTQEMEAELEEAYDETLFNWMGEKGLNARGFKEFRPKIIRSLLLLLQKKNVIKRVSRPQT